MSVLDKCKDAVRNHISDTTSLFGNIGAEGQSNNVISRESEYVNDINSRLRAHVIPESGSVSSAFTSAGNDLRAESDAFMNHMTEVWSNAQSESVDRNADDIAINEDASDDGFSVDD